MRAVRTRWARAPATAAAGSITVSGRLALDRFASGRLASAGLVLAGLVLAGLVLAGLVPVGLVPVVAAQAPSDAAPGAVRRVVLVGDSIMLGAAAQLEAAFAQAGYESVVDAAERRSTSGGASTASRRLSGGAEAVVLLLGANDAGNTDLYRRRVREVVAATALVPRLYWLTIPEVRAYYPAANRVIREELALRPGAAVLDWSAVSGGGGLTARDGLHLTPDGANAMAWFVALNVVGDLDEQFATTTSPTVSTTTTTVSTTSTTAAVRSTAAPSTAAPSTAAPSTTGSGSPDARTPVAELEDAAETAVDSSAWRFVPSAGVALAAVLAVLLILGASLAVWALWRTRGRA